MDEIEGTRIEHTIMELSSALLAMIQFDVFDHEEARPRNTVKMEHPISNAATSYWDAHLKRMVEVSNTIYGISVEGRFMDTLTSNGARWLFPLKKKRFLEKIGLLRWTPTFGELVRVAAFLRPHPPWRDAPDSQITRVLKTDKSPAGQLVALLTEAPAAWADAETGTVPIATSAYLFRIGRNTIPRVPLN